MIHEFSICESRNFREYEGTALTPLPFFIAQGSRVNNQVWILYGDQR